MSFALQYKKFIESEKGISKNLVSPRNVYRINVYKYADGETKSLSGQETALVFVLGVTPDKKISCVKLSLIKPEIFFRWLKNLFIKGLDESKFKSAAQLEDLVVISDRAGKKLFSSFLKSHPIYDKDPESYRTYNLKGIKSIEEVTFKKEILAKYYNPSFGKSNKASDTPDKPTKPQTL